MDFWAQIEWEHAESEKKIGYFIWKMDLSTEIAQMKTNFDDKWRIPIKF